MYIIFSKFNFHEHNTTQKTKQKHFKMLLKTRCRINHTSLGILHGNFHVTGKKIEEKQFEGLKLVF